VLFRSLPVVFKLDTEVVLEAVRSQLPVI